MYIVYTISPLRWLKTPLSQHDYEQQHLAVAWQEELVGAASTAHDFAASPASFSIMLHTII